jgi:hypothetical protein
MPPFLEPDFEQAEVVVFDAGQYGSFAQQSEWIEAFYKNVEDRMLNIYDAARLRAWRINDRQELAGYRQEQADWFDQMLARMQEARKTLRGFCVPEPAALRSLIENLTELVEACRGAHVFLAKALTGSREVRVQKPSGIKVKLDASDPIEICGRT